MTTQALIQTYQSVLDEAAAQKTKAWWERYMKGVIPFRGVGIPQNRALLKAWREANDVDRWPLERQLELALAFFREPTAEDKLAGVLYLQNYLYDRLPWERLLAEYEALYRAELIFDWNVCDWFCVRVLGPTIKKNGEACAKAVAAWKDAPYLWQARSSAVAFVNLASEKAYYPDIEEACRVLIRREERFAKTAVGWILREVSKHDGQFVVAFIDAHLPSFSKESLGNALKYFDKATQNRYLQRNKNG